MLGMEKMLCSLLGISEDELKEMINQLQNGFTNLGNSIESINVRLSKIEKILEENESEDDDGKGT